MGSYPAGASPYGVMDMAGNVWEWVADWFGAGYYSSSPTNNPPGPASGVYKVSRGGSFVNFWSGVRVVYRGNLHYGYPSDRNDSYGFRCVGVAPGP